MDGVTLVENPTEAEVVREAFAMVKAGDNVNKVASEAPCAWVHDGLG